MRGRARHLPGVLTAGPICVSHPLPPGYVRGAGRNDPGSLPPTPWPPHSCGRAGAKFIPDTSLPALLDLDPR